jgi:hypothetical protein
VLSNVGLNMTINCDVKKAKSLLPSGGLRETKNCCLAKDVSLLLSGGLRETTNQSHSLAQLIRLRNWKHDCQSLMLFPPIREKVRRRKSINCKMCQYSSANSMV